MALLRVQVILHTVSNLPQDFATNTWHFDDFDGEQEAIATVLTDFYVDIRGMLSPSIAQNGHEIKMYRYSDPPPRAPVFEDTFNLDAAPAGFQLPAEVALVLSYQAARVSGLPQSRRRGRVYIGPLNTGTLASGDARPASGTLATLATAGDTLLTASVGSSTWKWSTWSTVTNSGASVDNGWVDNAYDTQRRRGLEATTRVPFAV